jgi:hypothetical protein
MLDDPFEPQYVLALSIKAGVPCSPYKALFNFVSNIQKELM